MLAVAALAATVLVVRANGAEPYRLLGYADPGALTATGASVLRLAVDVAAAACVGFLVYALCFLDSPPDGRLSAWAWMSLRWAGMAAWAWSGLALVLVPFDGADSIGVSVGMVLSPRRLLDMLTSLYEPVYWLASAVAALVVAIGSQVILRWRATAGLLGVAVLGLLAPVAAGHTAAGPDHDLAMNAMIFHVVAAAAWLGVLLAVVTHAARSGGSVAEPVGRRYRRFALGCWLVLAGSGVVAAPLLVPVPQLLSTEYGIIVVGKALGLAAVGGMAIAARRKALGTGGRRGLARLLAVETVVLGLSTAVTMGLTQAPPPAWFVRELGTDEVAFGYALPEPPTVANLLTTWRVDLLLTTLAVTAALLYLLGVRRLRRRGERWPLGRSAAWLAGWTLVVVATSSGIGAYAPATFGIHMTMHMTLNMLAPLLLVLGGPVTLALRALPAAAPGTAAGPREWLFALTTSRTARRLSHPGAAALLFVCSYYLLYFTGLFEAATSEHWSRMALNLVTLAIGYQFYWIVIGVDAGPRTLPHLGRLGMAFAVMPFHAVFAVIVISIPTVLAESYYRLLGLQWATDLLADQRVGGVVSLVMGEIALVVAQVVLLVQWYQYDQLGAFRRDPLDGDDEESAAHREMLETWKRSRSPR
ncbi:copper resistance protein CopD [Pseudonocardia sp. MH-G8]|nr:copper resistance protein CopD [Pseudonocardia sp. MH-G8]